MTRDTRITLLLMRVLVGALRVNDPVSFNLYLTRVTQDLLKDWRECANHHVPTEHPGPTPVPKLKVQGSVEISQ